MEPVLYRDRLRLEGAALALSGLVASVLVLALAPDATDGMVSTVVQLVLVAAFMAIFATRAVRRWMDRADALEHGDPGAGEPTPLWALPLICAGLTLLFGLAEWQAGLRAAAGCGVVGTAQVLLGALVAAEERRRGVRFVRVPGSSLLRGTRLGALPAPRVT